MLLFLIYKRFVLVFGVLVFAFSTIQANVCDEHLLRIKYIPYEGESGVDAHYDALMTARRSAVPCLIANVTKHTTRTQSASDPCWRGDNGW